MPGPDGPIQVLGDCAFARIALMSARVVPLPHLSGRFRSAMTVGAVAAMLLLSGCALNPTTTGSIGNTPAAAGTASDGLSRLAAQYQRNPKDRTTALYYAQALRANDLTGQAAAVLENAIAIYPNDPTLQLAYAKALAASGKLDQALTMVDQAINPAEPDWNALLVKGAILDQDGQNAAARQCYADALKIAPNQPSLHANLGLSYAMTNELDKAEKELRIAVSLPGATSQVRQNLALIVGLQGRFDEAQKLFSAEMPPEKVASNMDYIRALLTQQNRWDLIKGNG
jgi:Flp pilus assembly protein TadD